MKTLFIAFLTLLWGCGKAEKATPNQPNKPNEPEEVITPDTKGDYSQKIVAHRGAWKEFGFPDNSMAAFVKALELEFLGTECDVMLTADQKVIVYHDEMIGGKYIKNLNYETDIKGKYFLANGEDIPLLSDFLQVLKESSSKTQLWIDLKSLSDLAGGNAQTIQAAKISAELIKKEKLENKVTFIIGRKAVLDGALPFVNGAWPVGYMNTVYTPQQFANAGFDWANFNYTAFYDNNSLLKSKIQDYTHLNIKVSVYTIDDVVIAKRFLDDSEIFAVSTNIPNTLKKLN